MALALDEPKETDTLADEKGYKFCIDNELLAQVQEVKIDFSYMGFSVDPKVPLAGAGAGCGGCSGGTCSTAG